MEPTLTSWAVDLANVGPLYPMVGTEFVLFLIGMVCWLLWHVLQIRSENRTCRDDVKRLDTPDKLTTAVREHHYRIGGR